MKKNSISPFPCSEFSYQNVDRTRCIPCQKGMKYNANISMCVCITTNHYPVGGYCVDGGSSFSNPIPESSNPLDRVLYGIAAVGCSAINPSK